MYLHHSKRDAEFGIHWLKYKYLEQIASLNVDIAYRKHRSTNFADMAA
jgi:hypothetical protein